MTELEEKLKTALTNIEEVRQTIIKRINEEDYNSQKQFYTLIDYKLELLDVKLRLKDMLEHLDLIQSD